MTAMCDDLGQGGDVAVAAIIVDAHRRCPDCAASSCETGAWAIAALAAYRRERWWPPQPTTGRNQRPADCLGVTS